MATSVLPEQAGVAAWHHQNGSNGSSSVTMPPIHLPSNNNNSSSSGGSSKTPNRRPMASGSVTERSRGRYGGRPGNASMALSVAAAAGAAGAGGSGDGPESGIRHATEAQISRQLAEMEEANLEAINSQATRMRIEYDKLRLATKQRGEALRKVSDKLQRLDKLASGSHADDMRVGKQIDRTKRKKEAAKEQYEEALFKRDMYTYMATRLKQQTGDIDKNVKEMQHKYTRANARMEKALLSLHVTKQQAVQADQKVLLLQRKLQQGRVQRQRKLAQFDSTIQSQESKRKGMEEREAKRADIGKFAQGDLGEEEEDRLKHLLRVRQAYLQMLQSSLDAKRKACDELEDAFQRIRSSTGLDRVDDIIDKFVSRDATNAALEKQLEDARTKVEDLRLTNKHLQHMLTTQQLSHAAPDEHRHLYQKVDDYDRRLAEAQRVGDEAKKRSFKIMITLEESRGCVSKLLNKLSFDPSKYRRRSRRSKSPRPTSTESSVSDMPQDAKGNYIISVENLPKAIDALEEKLATYLGFVAAILEKEADMGREGAGEAGVRQMAPRDAKEIISTVVQSGATLLSNLSARHQPGLATADSLAAQRSTMSMLAGKASDRVYRSMMQIQLNTEPSNVRIKPMVLPSAYSDSDDEEAERQADDIEEELQLMDMLEGGEPPLSKRLPGHDLTMVVERDSLKRLSAMISEKKTKKRPARKPRSPGKGRARRKAAIQEESSEGEESA